MRHFTKREDKFLLVNKDLIPAKRMSKMLNRSESSARQRMKLIGAIPTPEAVERFRKDSQIKPGTVPPNKGKKMPASTYKKVKATMFKKGQRIHNEKFDGAISIRTDKTKRNYKFIRTSKGVWQALHVYIWKKSKRRVPKGKIVVFKDKNTMNCKLGNLECITRVENMKRNTYHNYPKPIANLIQLRGALNRQINKHSKRLK